MKKSSYNKYQEMLRTLEIHGSKGSFPKITLCHGNSAFLINRTLEIASKLWQERCQLPSFKHNCSELTINDFLALYEQQSIFEPASLQIIDQCEKQKKISEYLLKLKDNTDSVNSFIFSLHYTNKPPTKLVKLFKDLGAYEILCLQPPPFEVKNCLQDLAKQHLLILEQASFNLLLEFVGNNLANLDQELRRLNLIFAVTEPTKLTTADISPHLNMISESLAFKLRSLILERKKSQAHCLLVDLLNRGESPLAILGILAKHCRNAINVQAAKRQSLSSGQISQKYRLQSFLVNHYIKYVSRIDIGQFNKALRACYETDRAIKTGKQNEGLLLANIIEGLC